ncbi:MAG: hypothetical protein ACYCXD_05755 [Coriobacteriia bacterium]
MLRGRNGERLRFPEALFWSLTWGIGAGIGVALGGWLTVVGGSGAPGAGGLDIGVDVIALPLATLAVVSVAHLIGQLIASALRGRSDERAERKDAE